MGGLVISGVGQVATHAMSLSIIVQGTNAKFTQILEGNLADFSYQACMILEKKLVKIVMYFWGVGWVNIKRLWNAGDAACIFHSIFSPSFNVKCPWNIACFFILHFIPPPPRPAFKKK